MTKKLTAMTQTQPTLKEELIDSYYDQVKNYQILNIRLSQMLNPVGW